MLATQPSDDERGRGAGGSMYLVPLGAILIGCLLGASSPSAASEPALPDIGSTLERLALTGTIETPGFEPPRWGSFEHVDPLSSPPRRRADARRFVVVIDAGHGGRDPGTTAPNGLLEKDVTLDIAHRVRRFMAEFGDIEIRLTREDDISVSREARVAAIRASEADLFVSLHFNHLPQRDVVLVESYHAGPEEFAESRARGGSRGAYKRPLSLVARLPETLRTQSSERIATLVQRRVFEAVSGYDEDAIDAGVKRDTLFVLTQSATSGTLVELTCLSNPTEAERLSDSSYRTRLAVALVDAIRDYRASLRGSPLESAHPTTSLAPALPEDEGTLATPSALPSPDEARPHGATVLPRAGEPSAGRVLAAEHGSS